jgi:type I restriction enzyme S subunit
VSEWKEATLKELVDVVVDNRGKTPPISDSGHELLEVNAISQDARTPDYSKVRKFVSEETYRNWFRKGHPKPGDILVPTVGTIGNVSLVQEDRGAIAQNLIALRLKKNIDSGFVYYFLSSPLGKDLMISLDIGGVQPSIKVPHLLDLKISLPEYEEQKFIASVLSSLDEKIDLLHRQNKTLEAMAETLFRQWFVEGAGEAKPVLLGDYVEVFNGVSYKSEDLQPSKTAMVTLKSFDRNGGFRLDGFKEFTGKYKPDHVVEQGDLVVAHTDITQDAAVIGNPILVVSDPSYEKMVVSMDLVKVKSKFAWISNEFLYVLMRTQDFKQHCLGYSNGSTVLHLSKKAIPLYEFNLPEKGKVEEFSVLAKKLLDKKFKNIEHGRVLGKIRDNLLPKLMSGEVRVA